ncbi:MAG: hypothetical protein AAGL24_06355 [Pseudomonadota bacterium]
MTAHIRNAGDSLGFNWECVAAVNNESVLQENLLASPDLKNKPLRLRTFREMPSASLAYNAGLDATKAEIVVFAHQDVYMPAGWDKLLRSVIEQLTTSDPTWAVAGLTGVTPNGDKRGRCWSSGLGIEFGVPFDEPIHAVSIDELLIVLRRSSNLRFDDDLPGFHLYGTDIVQQALSQGLGAYIIHAPVIHNSVPVLSLAGGYTTAYRYMQRKWRKRLPITTLITPITRTGIQLWRRKMQMNRLWSRFARRQHHRVKSVQRPDPVDIAQRLGYETSA